MTARNGNAGDLGVRLGIFTVGFVALTLLIGLVFRGLPGSTLLTGGAWGSSLLALVAGIPLVGAAALAWFLPRTAVSAATGPVRPLSRVFILAGVAVGLMILLSFAFSGVSSWSNSSGLAGTFSAPIGRVGSALLSSVLTCAAVFGVLVPLWRRLLTPAWSGLASALTVQVPLLLATLIAAAFVAASAPGGVGLALLGLLVRAAV